MHFLKLKVQMYYISFYLCVVIRTIILKHINCIFVTNLTIYGYAMEFIEQIHYLSSFQKICPWLKSYKFKSVSAHDNLYPCIALENTLPLWVFYVQHKGKSTVRLRSSAYMFQDCIQTVRNK